MIGTLGPITFNVSRERIQNFEDFNIQSSARIATHENFQNKPILEFIGPGLDSISLKMNWTITGKLNPLVEIKKLLDKKEKGEVVLFFMGGKPVGEGKYLIENISRVNKIIDDRGNILSMEIDISLLEYVDNIKKVSMVRTETPKQTNKNDSNTKKITKVKKSNKQTTNKKKQTKKKIIKKQKTKV